MEAAGKRAASCGFPAVQEIQLRRDASGPAAVGGGPHPLLCGSLFDPEVDPACSGGLGGLAWKARCRCGNPDVAKFEK